MADSPFCMPCWDRGKMGHTYRLAGQPNFLCHDCKTVYHEGLFEPWELEWKSDRRAWASGMEKKVKDGKAKEVFEAHLKRLDDIMQSR